MVGANVASQYEQTIKRDIESDLPKQFVSDYSAQKQYMDLINGHRILYRPFDDPNKLRSYNLTMFVMIEGSECKSESYTQLGTRLRNLAATIPKRDELGDIVYKTSKTGVPIPVIEHDFRKGIIESNPDSGWIKDGVLLVADKINKHGRVVDSYDMLIQETNPAVSAHITATDCNEFLPPTFYQDVAKNKPAWWIAKYLHGSFMYSAGLVYPNAARIIVPTFDVEPHWRRIIAHDYGLSDNSTFLFGAIDERASLLYLYKEVVTNEKSLEQLANIFKKETEDIPRGGYVCPPVIDPKSGMRRDYNKKSLMDHYLEYGINFKPGHVNIDARIFRLNTYIESGRLRIMDCCVHTIKELREYKFATKSDSEAGFTDKPEDKNNHCINALEWICMELPADPGNLIYGAYNSAGQDITKVINELQRNRLHALSDYDYYTESKGESLWTLS